ncbi:MAG: DUF1080 domain-containing protein [Phycisphaerae bacterium]|nr:DUF1080 domain-containing protein [Phycisphaerae bacterium]
MMTHRTLHRIAIAMSVLLAAGASSLPAEQAAEPKPLKVLMIVGGIAHDYETLPPKLARVLGKDEDMIVEVTGDLGRLTDEHLRPFDVLVFNNCHDADLSEDQRQAVLSALRRNTGLVAVHCALWSFQSWPEWRNIVGALVLGHDPFASFDVVVVDHEHPINTDVPDRFTIADEPYLVTEWGGNNHVLLRTAALHGGRDKPEPMAWTTRYHGSRVVSIMPGHDEQAQAAPAFQTLLANGIRWAGRRLGPATLLSEEERQEGFVPLFDSKTLANWRFDRRYWKTRDGLIIGNTHPDGLKKHTYAITEQAFGDFILRYSVNLVSGNSGVQFRSLEWPDYEVAGYQADVVLPFGWGNLHEQNGRRKLVDGWTGKADRNVQPGWNDMEVIAQGPRVILKTNGVVTADWTETDADVPKAGIVALQLHGGDPMEVQYTNIRIKPIPSATQPATAQSPGQE